MTIELSKKDYVLNAFQRDIKSLSNIGSALVHFIYGAMNESRMRRIEQTLQEITAMLSDVEYLNVEKFALLMEKTSPEIAIAVDEFKNHRYRDLLVNSIRKQDDKKSHNTCIFESKVLGNIDSAELELTWH